MTSGTVVNVLDIVSENRPEGRQRSERNGVARWRGERGARVTIGDVASRAGVSIATVSRVVNGRYGVAAPTIHRVREVIDELGYESSLVARSLRSQRTNVIGILVADIEPFSAELLKGAARRRCTTPTTSWSSTPG